MTTDYHPFVRASLRKAVRRLLADRHGHVTHTEMLTCEACMARLWVELGHAASKRWIGGE